MTLKRRAPYKIVMDALEAGLEVKLGHYTWVMRDRVDTISEWGAPQDQERPMVLIKMWNETENLEHCINPGISVNDFIRLCERLTDEELMTIGANTVLNNMKRRAEPA